MFRFDLNRKNEIDEKIEFSVRKQMFLQTRKDTRVSVDRNEEITNYIFVYTCTLSDNSPERWPLRKIKKRKLMIIEKKKKKY